MRSRAETIVASAPADIPAATSSIIAWSPRVGRPAPLVRRAFERYGTGRYSLRDMAAWAKSVGLRSTKGGAIDRLSVGKILRNVSYTGAVAHHRRGGGAIVARDAHLPSVSSELFEHVQERLSARRLDGATNPRPFGKSP